MPTDENNWVNPQNQQVNPTSWDSDDFDFSFDDSNTDSNTADQNWSWLSWDMQDQMRRQWRSGMFLTPDEAITKSNDDNDMSLWNIDISSTVQPQQRSGMFLTPDEEANKEESQIEWKQYSFQWAAENQAADSDDSYLAWIDPGDVEESQDWNSNDWQQETPIQDNDYSQEKLDDEIEDLISFWDEPKTDNVSQWPVVEQAVAEPEQVNQSTQEQASVEEAVEQPLESVAEQPVEQTVEPVVQPEQSVEPVESNDDVQNNSLNQNVQEGQDSQTLEDSKWWNSEDRLSQEDKKVEESFWTVPESVSQDIDVSPENVVQNVENVINESVDTSTQNIEPNIPVDLNMDAVVQPTEQNDLHIENMGTDVVENWNWDLISDTWWMQQIDQENTYVPNEAEFNQMSDLLNSSSTWQIDLSNLNPEQSSEPVNLSTDFPVEQQEVVVPSTETSPVETVAPVEQDNTIQNQLENNVNDELLKYEWVGMQWQVVSQEVQPSQEAQQNVVVEPSSAEINLDSLVQDTEPVNQEGIQTNDIGTWSVIWAVNEWENVEQVTQPVAQKKRKKQSWFTVMWIFFGVLLLWVWWYVATKMFPDKFANIFSSNTSVSQETYTYWDFEYTIDGLYLDVYPEDSSKTVTVVETGEDYTMTTTDNEDTINYLNGKPAKTIPLSTENFMVNPEYKEGKYTIYDMSFIDLNLNLSKADLESLLQNEIKDTTVDKSYVVEVVLKYKLNKYPANFKYFRNINTWRFAAMMFSFLNPSLAAEDGNDMFDVNINKSISQVINIAVISKEDESSDVVIEYGDELGEEELSYLLNYLMLSEEDIDSEPDASKVKCIMFYTVDGLEDLIDQYNWLDMINWGGSFSFSTEVDYEWSQSWWEELDPNSLAGLLENNWEDSGDWQEDVSNWENLDNQWEENQSDNIETQTWDNTASGTEDFDPFAWIDEILWEAQEYIDRLNSYVESWQYYVDWWDSNWKLAVKNAWSKVVDMAQAELTKLENWEEIDTTAFDRMDELLKKLSSLAK